MKKVIALFSITILIFSCGKKEEKKETDPILNTIIKNSVSDVPVTNKVVENPLVFTVQIAALKNKNKELASLANVKMFEENGLTKYRFGAFKTYEEAKQYRAELRNSYKGAFVQALKNGMPIHIKEALN